MSQLPAGLQRTSGSHFLAGSHSSARASSLSYACARASCASPAQIQRTKQLHAALQRKSSAWFQNFPTLVTFLPGGRFNASSTIPAHGAGPWVIVETPTRHHPRRRGRPIPRRLLFGWVRERVRICGRALAPTRVARDGRPPKATSTPRENSTRVFRKPASFLCAYVYFETEPDAETATKLRTRDESRRIAANIAKLSKPQGACRDLGHGRSRAAS